MTSARLQYLVNELTGLDEVLRRRVETFRGRTAEPDHSTTYDIPDAEVDDLLAPPSTTGSPAEAATLDRVRAAYPELARGGAESPLSALAEAFDLTDGDLDAVVVCLAPEVDRRYERLYGYLHADATRRSPTVDLILDVCCGDAVSRLSGRARFAPAAALVRHRLVTVADEPGRPSSSLLDQVVRLSPRAARFLLEPDDPTDLDERLAAMARVVVPPACEPVPALRRMVERLGRLGDLADPRPVLVRSHERAAWACAMALGAASDARILVVQGQALAGLPAFECAEMLALVSTECRLARTILHLADADQLPGEVLSSLLRTLRTTMPVFLPGSTDLPMSSTAGLAVLPLEVAIPGADERLAAWSAALGKISDPADREADVARLAAVFRFDEAQIADAGRTAQVLATLRDGAGTPDGDDLHSAARLHTNRALGSSAQRIALRYDWDDLVLPAARTDQLREIADTVRYRDVVHDSWGFGARAVASPGLNVLFTGPPGTGKTMAAAVLAKTLRMDLYRIDLSSMVSKYVGETEKNLARVFDEAATSESILFFDEADALFGKRTQVRDAHDRYANVQTSYLLQRLETHSGVVVLATNLRKNMDEAFVRRLHATVDFALPDVSERLRIWQRIWPADAPLGPDVDLDLLAAHVDLPGGHLRNIAVAAAFLAAADSGKVTLAHVVHATRREYQKLGKVMAPGRLSDLDDVQETRRETDPRRSPGKNV